MLRFLRRWLPSEPPALPAPEQRPAWVDDLLEAHQKQARAQGKLGARVEALEAQLVDGLAAVCGAVATANKASWKWDELFDAMDVLDEARRTTAAAGSARVAEGLGSVLARIERFAASAGMTRMAPIGEPLDSKRFRVVGTEPSEGREGIVARVVRAAIVDGERVMRDGEVIVSSKVSRTIP